jgi:hypothetical protein
VFQKLVSHNDDLRRLVEKGYAVGFDSNYLIVRDIPYLDGGGALHIGAFVAKLVHVDQEHVIQDDHQVYFAGTFPHGLDGRPIPNLAGGPHPIPLSDAAKDVVVQRSFSNKPKGTGKFTDFFDKIESYTGIIAGPAIERHGVSPYTFRVATAVETDSVFKVHDTLTSRAEIADLSTKFRNDVVALIGLGGTGGYLLDFLVKTPVREIRAFDPDAFHVHNAFRSPGRLDLAELGRAKTDVYHSRYENFRTGLSVQAKFIDASCGADFDGVTFAFVCVDKGSSRAGIFDLLLAKDIPFIDVGMGLKRKDGFLNGMARTTYYSAEQGLKMRDKGLAELNDQPDNLYRTNIQTGELNALNAALAVIRFKQLRAFYFEEIPNYHLLFEIGDIKIVGETNIDEA